MKLLPEGGAPAHGATMPSPPSEPNRNYWLLEVARRRYWAVHTWSRTAPRVLANVIDQVAKAVLARLGISKYMANVLLDDIKADFRNTKLPLSRRLWAYRHGFLGRRIGEYGLTPRNLHNFVSDFRYCKLHPLNRYSHWIDDKLTTKYILQGFSDFLPRYYFELRRGSVTRLMDCPPGLDADPAAILQLLRTDGQLALKPASGSGGQGFFRISVGSDELFVNDRSMSEADFAGFLQALDDYLVTEYIEAHDFIRTIWDGAPNALRVIAVHNEDRLPVIAGAYARFGTSSTGAVDNVDAGGIACGVDVVDGRLYGPRRHEGDRWVATPCHPDTGRPIEGNVPNWSLVTATIVAICNYLPHLRWMSFDIVVTNAGLKIIEINSHGAIYVMQSYFPLLENREVGTLFCATH